MGAQAKHQLPLPLDDRERLDRAMRAAFENCRALRDRKYEDVIQVPFLKTCISIMAEIRIKRGMN